MDGFNLKLGELAALIGASLTFVIGVLGWRQRRDEAEASILQQQNESSHTEVHGLIGELQEEVERLRRVNLDRETRYEQLYQQQQMTRREVELLKDRFRDWANGIRMLVAQIRDLGHRPVWLPEDTYGQENPLWEATPPTSIPPKKP